MKDRDTLYPRVVEVNDSTNILEVAYDPIDKIMRTTFKGNVKYIYKNVAMEAFADVVSASSVGSVFNELVRSGYLEGEKVDE